MSILSLESIEARRRNALRSTGPRTPAGKAVSRYNALKHGRYAGAGIPALAAFNESPEEFTGLLRELLDSYRPTTPAERLLVEDIAHLRWKQRRNRRAQEALHLQSLERLECERQRRCLEIQNENPDVSSAQVRQAGLLRAPDSPAKFKDAIDLVETILKAVERGDFDGIETLLETMHGQDPSLRGVRISNLCRKLASLHQSLAAARRPWPPPHLGLPAAPGAQENESAPPSGDEDSFLAQLSEEQILEAMAFRDLRMALLEEQRDLVEKYQLYLREHVQITPAMRSACLAPQDSDQWRVLLRQENTIERQLDRKTRLLWQMKESESRRRRATAEKESFLRNRAARLLKTRGVRRKLEKQS